MAQHYQLLVIGGGNAGLSAAAHLLLKSPKTTVGIVEPSEKHYYQPAWTLVGGGAFLFKKAVKAAFPKHRIHEVKEPMFANVRGFQLAGQNYAASAIAPGRDRGAGEIA